LFFGTLEEKYNSKPKWPVSHDVKNPQISLGNPKFGKKLKILPKSSKINKTMLFFVTIPSTYLLVLILKHIFCKF
jgi:hypothetical protein